MREARLAECRRVGCYELVIAKGLCWNHYTEQRRRAAGIKPKRIPKAKPGQPVCPVPECPRPMVSTKGYCVPHAERLRKYGDVNAIRKVGRPKSEPRQCSVPACESAHYAKSYCASHYMRWRKNGDPRPDQPLNKFGGNSRCSVEGCGRRNHAHGYCGAHLHRWQTWGDPLIVTLFGASRPTKPIKPYRILETGELVE